MEAERQLFADSFPRRPRHRGDIRAQTREQGLVVYQHIETGELKFDRSAVPVFNRKHGRFDSTRFPPLDTSAGYRVLLIEHTHPWAFTYGSFCWPCYGRGPSKADFEAAKDISRRHPGVFHVIHAVDYWGDDEFYYYGE